MSGKSKIMAFLQDKCNDQEAKDFREEIKYVLSGTIKNISEVFYAVTTILVALIYLLIFFPTMKYSTCTCMCS